ncbi:restriction endonuclease subunit S [Prosthecochloris sp.]|uniref:restriction endonuclease subunit S n=1 Tax=Prosthecochloris sp. TaxID=290513 RepID=UPI00257C68CF|nr:restriction endonuclease subunit S [Prosthecochloris sp.]
MSDHMHTGQVEANKAQVPPSKELTSPPFITKNGQNVERDSRGSHSMGEWQRTTVGKVASDFLSGGTPATSRADYWTGEIPWITSKWLGYKLELTTGEKLISEEAVKNTATKIVPKDSIIFATRVGVGKVGINRIDLAINQDLAGVLIDKEKYDIKFLAYQLETDSIQQYVEMNKRGATIKGITRDCLEQIQLNIPPLPEQKKIAHILSTVQRAIEAQERIIQTTTELKKALMHKLFTEGLRNEPQKETEIGLVPESWEVVELGNMLNVAQYGLSVKGNAEGNYPILRMTNQVDGQIIDHNLQYVEIGESDFEKFKVERGDILFNRTNSLDLVGRTAIFDIKGNFVFASYLIRLRTDTKQLDPFFLNSYFNTDEIQTRLKSIATRAVSQSNISATRLKGFPVPKPCLVEQKKIVGYANALERKLAVHSSKLAQHQNLFRSLLNELMTANINLNNLNTPAG